MYVCTRANLVHASYNNNIGGSVIDVISGKCSLNKFT